MALTMKKMTPTTPVTMPWCGRSAKDKARARRRRWAPTARPPDRPTYRLVEHLGEDQQEDDVDEVDHDDGDVERVRLLVHPRTQDADAHEQGGLDENQGDGLREEALLGEPDEGGLEEDVGEHGHDEVVRRGPVLHVEEAPLVQRGRVGVEDVARILVHVGRLARQSDHLPGRPGQGDGEREEEEDREYDLGRGIASGQLPEAQDAHLRVTDEGLSVSHRGRRSVSAPSQSFLKDGRGKKVFGGGGGGGGGMMRRRTRR